MICQNHSLSLFSTHPEHWDAVFGDAFRKDISYFDGSYIVHLWNELLRKAKFDKKCDFDK